MSGGGNRELILARILTALDGLKAAPSAPYNMQVKLTSRELIPVEDLVRATQFPALFVVAGEHIVDPDFEYRQMELSTLVVEIVGVIQARGAISTTLNKLIEDVKRKLMEDRLLGGASQDLKSRGIPQIDEESMAGDGVGGFRMKFEALYTHLASEI